MIRKWRIVQKSVAGCSALWFCKSIVHTVQLQAIAIQLGQGHRPAQDFEEIERQKVCNLKTFGVDLCLELSLSTFL